jgi:hypothetical protein
MDTNNHSKHQEDEGHSRTRIILKTTLDERQNKHANINSS